MREHDGSACALVDIGHAPALDFYKLLRSKWFCAIGHCFSSLEHSESVCCHSFVTIRPSDPRTLPPSCVCPFVRLLLFPPLCVKLRDRRADGKSPGKHKEILEFLRHDVPVLCLCRRHARFEQLARLLGDVVKDLEHRGDTALPAKLPMPRHEHRVLVPRRKGLQRRAPPGKRRLLVKARGIPPVNQ